MADTPRAVVRNAADPQQVRRGARVEQRAGDRYDGAFRIVLGTPAGRALIWEILARVGVYRSIWSPNVQIHYNAGRQDVGHELMADAIRIAPDLYELMEHEARMRDARDNVETDAAHTALADATGDPG